MRRPILALMLWLAGLAALIPGTLSVLSYVLPLEFVYYWWIPLNSKLPDWTDVALPVLGLALWIAALIIAIPTIPSMHTLQLVVVVLITIVVGFMSLAHLAVTALLAFAMFIITGGGIG